MRSGSRDLLLLTSLSLNLASFAFYWFHGKTSSAGISSQDETKRLVARQEEGNSMLRKLLEENRACQQEMRALRRSVTAQPVSLSVTQPAQSSIVSGPQLSGSEGAGVSGGAEELRDEDRNRGQVAGGEAGIRSVQSEEGLLEQYDTVLKAAGGFDSAVFASLQTKMLLDVARKYYIAPDHSFGDKITCPGNKCKHAYEQYLAKYIVPIRYQKLKFLEIGLGCNMAYGAGASVRLWPQLLPNAEIWMAEVSRQCVEAKRAIINEQSGGRVKLLVGDQANPSVLKDWVDQSGGMFDIVVDDGGHTNNQQWVTLTHLWGAVKPGGMLIIEDLSESHLPLYGKIPGGTVPLMIKRIGLLVEDLVSYGAPQASRNNRNAGFSPSPYYELLPNLKDIDCMPEACVFTKCSGLEPRCP